MRGDVLAVLLNVSVETITRILRSALLIAPPLTWLVAFWVCRWLRATRVHPATPTAGVRLRRTPSGVVRDHLAGPWEQRQARR